MTGGGPLNITLSVVLFIYKQAFQYYNMCYSATLGFLCFLNYDCSSGTEKDY
jgi:ABC-type sugar transport system permease subunit